MILDVILYIYSMSPQIPSSTPKLPVICRHGIHHVSTPRYHVAQSHCSAADCLPLHAHYTRLFISHAPSGQHVHSPTCRPVINRLPELPPGPGRNMFARWKYLACLFFFCFNFFLLSGFGIGGYGYLMSLVSVFAPTSTTAPTKHQQTHCGKACTLTASAASYRLNS